MNDVRDWCLSHSMPSYLKTGIYFVSLTEVAAYEVKLRAAQGRIRDVLVPALVQALPAQIVEAQAKLDDQFNPADYPTDTVMKRLFGIEWNWITFNTPENLPESVKREEAEKLRKKYEDAQKEMVATLRLSFSEITTSAVNRLLGEPGKKMPKLTKATLKRFDDFFDTFTARNLMEDDELSATVEEARNLLAGVSIENLNKDTRVEIGQKMEVVKTKIEALVAAAPSRRFFLEEESK